LKFSVKNKDFQVSDVSADVDAHCSGRESGPVDGFEARLHSSLEVEAEGVNGEGITCLLDDLPNEDSAQALWEYFFPRLVDFAEQKLRGLPCQIQDEEDIALSAMHSLFQVVSSGKYELKSRQELWSLLATIAFRKVLREQRRQLAGKRGGGVVHLGNRDGEADSDLIDSIADVRQMPELIHQVHEQCKDLLDSLPQESLRVTARMKLDGCSNSEICDLLRCNPHDTKSRLKKIRQLWRRQLEWKE